MSSSAKAIGVTRSGNVDLVGCRPGRETSTSGRARPRHEHCDDAEHPSARITKAQELGLTPRAIPKRSWKPRKVWVARDGIFPKSPKCLSSYAPFESTLEAIAHLHLSVDFRIKCYLRLTPSSQKTPS